MNYRRARVGGGTYFFTVNLAQREGRLLVDHIDILRNAVRYVKTRHPFHIDAFVVLPDHLLASRASESQRELSAQGVEPD